ncbi:putative quinol monooxygenase [Agrococcus terreus]|uniref:ABM domain-containing protein n=1 Tax=Agrococcus terreus TaxID=574649 RepID=A0ABQ2KJ38_9MICO|nr:antibiotic biosynthesis monooxygenase [Agrococcus terreus]GGN84970.1 hypothetical protein GCM10010968_17330 [Agrococcus terreus]
MLSVWVELEVLEGQESAFLDAIARNQRASLDDEPGCWFFDVLRLDESGRRWAFYEIYRDARAFFEEHRSAPHYAEWKAAVAATVVPGSQVVTTAERALPSPSAELDRAERPGL